MARIGHALYTFVADFLSTQARQPDVVVAVGIFATGIIVAMPGAPLGAIFALAVHPDAAVVTLVALFAGGMTISMAGMVVLTISIFVDAFRRKH